MKRERPAGRGALRGVSLRLKITVAFVLIVLGGTGVSVAVGSRIISRALLGQAEKRVGHGLKAARLVYLSRLERVRRIVTRAAWSERVLGGIRGGAGVELERALALHRQAEWGVLDFLSFLAADGSRATRGAAPSGPPAAGLAPLLAAARAGRSLESFEALPPEELELERRQLSEGARLPSENGESRLHPGMVLVAAVPVREQGKTLGTLYGGVLLNTDRRVIDQIQEMIFGGKDDPGGERGAISFFLGDQRIATNLTLPSGKRQIGTRVAPEIAAAALTRGEPWSGRARVIDSQYVTAYEPIRNFRGRPIGMVGVGLEERQFLRSRTDMMLSFLVVAAVGVVIVLALTYLIARSMMRPLEEMAEVTRRIAAGDLGERVTVRAEDEIGLVAASFNSMLDSVLAMRAELEEFAGLLEDKVRSRTEELISVQSRMAQSEKLASLGRMAAGVAHEVNNPLGGILTFSMLALEECEAEHPLRGKLELISKQALRCRDIVKGLLEFSRQSESQPAPTDLNAVLEKTLQLVSNQSLFQNIKTITRLAPGLPAVLIDAGQLQQVILNLVLNAIDAMEQDGTLTLETAREELESGGVEVRLAIADTGKGIAKEVLPLIFEPFFTTKRVGQGTGLGLAIVHGIVSRVKGRIEVASSPAGTTFTVCLPLPAP